MSLTALRRLRFLILAGVAVIILAGLVWYRFHDPASRLSSSILRAERIDIKVDGGASPTGVGFRYTLSNEDVIRKIAEEVKNSSHNEYRWGIPAVDGTVTVLAFGQRSDSIPNAHVIFAFTGDTYSYDPFRLGTRAFQMDSTTLYQHLAERKMNKKIRPHEKR